MNIARAALATLAFAFALGAHAQRLEVVAQGTANQNGVVGKIVSLSATQASPGSLAATGSALLIQVDHSGIFGDFALLGNVVCMRADSPTQITVGLQLVWGLGTAQGHAGEPFYIVVQGNSASGGSDVVDNGGFGSAPGEPSCFFSPIDGGNGPFASGGVVITSVP